MCGRAHPHLQHSCPPAPRTSGSPAHICTSLRGPFPGTELAEPLLGAAVPSPPGGPDRTLTSSRTGTSFRSQRLRSSSLPSSLSLRLSPFPPPRDMAARTGGSSGSRAKRSRCGRGRLGHGSATHFRVHVRTGPSAPPAGPERSTARGTGAPVPLQGTPGHSPAFPAGLAEVRSVAFTVKPSSWGKEICHLIIAPSFVSRGTQHPTIKQPFND